MGTSLIPNAWGGFDLVGEKRPSNGGGNNGFDWILLILFVFIILKLLGVL